MKRVIVEMLVVCLLLGVVGCVSSVNPQTGETMTHLDSNAVANLEKMADMAAVIMSILGTIWPALLPIAGYVIGAVRISRKITPKLTKAQTEAEMYHTAALSTALGIDEFKKAYPSEWVKLEDRLIEIKKKLIKPEDQLKIENLIRGLRGLPPKE